MGRNLTGTNHGQTRLYNRRVVLETIRVFGPISRAEIARRTSLMYQTVSNIVGEFRQQQIVHTVGRSKATRGQPAVLVALNENAAFTYGLHLNRNQIRGLLVDLAGNVRAHDVRWVDSPTTAETFTLLGQMTTRLRQSAGIPEEDVIGAGLVLPGPVDDETRLTAALSHPEWQGVEIMETLGGLLGVPVSIERDAQAAALGERLHGEGRAVEDFLYIDFGIGLGGGLVLGGQPYRGRHGYAGEIGHYPAVRNGRKCSCGAHGCLETYCSFGALLADCGIAVFDETTLQHVSNLLTAGNGQLLAWLDQAADHLSPA
ncbi:MAG: ROK family transcriptional regulator, partial [Alphaproteobacteria bacterium]